MADNLPPNVRVIRDVKYGDNGDANTLDLYLPENMQAKTPVIIWIHGGGWQQGEKGPWPALAMVDKGYAVATINYRLSGTAKFPAQLDDTKEAVRWLRENADKHNLDPDRFGAWGSSAGGHLAALLGTSASYEELKDPKAKKAATSSQVQAVCDWCGITDVKEFAAFRSRKSPDAANQMVTKFLGGSVKDKAELAEKASPITFVSDKSPPFLIMHGDRDDVVPIEQSRLLAEALKKKGVAVELIPIDGAGHGLESMGTNGELLRVEKFFDKTLRGIDDNKKLGIDVDYVKELAVFTHRSAGQQGKSLTLFSNGLINKLDGRHTWSIKDNKLALNWYTKESPSGVWLDTVTLDNSGQSYQGKNQNGVAIRGTLDRGINLNDLTKPEIDVSPSAGKRPDVKELPIDAALSRATGARWNALKDGYSIPVSGRSPGQIKDAMSQFSEIIKKEVGSTEGLSLSPDHIKIDEVLAKKIVGKFLELQEKDTKSSTKSAEEFLKKLSGTNGPFANVNFERAKAEMESIAGLVDGIKGFDTPEIKTEKAGMTLVFKEQNQANAFAKLLVEARSRAKSTKDTLEFSVPTAKNSVTISYSDLSSMSQKELDVFLTKATEVFKEEKNKAKKPGQKLGAANIPNPMDNLLTAVEQIEKQFGSPKSEPIGTLESGQLTPTRLVLANLATANKKSSEV